MLAIGKTPGLPMDVLPGYGELASTYITLPEVLPGCGVLVLAKTTVLHDDVVLPGKSVLYARSGCLPCASPCTCCTTGLIFLGKAFCRPVLKLSNVLCTSSVITHVELEKLLPYLLATAMSINITNSSGVMLGVTVDASATVAVVMMVGVVFLITPVRLF
jgi:hypothetical protein